MTDSAPTELSKTMQSLAKATTSQGRALRIHMKDCLAVRKEGHKQMEEMNASLATLSTNIQALNDLASILRNVRRIIITGAGLVLIGLTVNVVSNWLFHQHPLIVTTTTQQGTPHQ